MGSELLIVVGLLMVNGLFAGAEIAVLSVRKTRMRPDTRHRAVIWSYGIDSAVRIWYNNSTLHARKDVEFGVTNTPTRRDLILDFSGRW